MLARRFQGQLQLADDESEEDALAGCSAVALKRASLFGPGAGAARPDGGADASGGSSATPPDLIAFRQPLFAEVANPTTTPSCAGWSTWCPGRRPAARPTRWPTPTGPTGAACSTSERRGPHRLAVGPLTFDALAAGPDGGEPVLLLHGFPQTSRAWVAQLEALGGAGYRAVAFDQRGYSPRARPRRSRRTGRRS